MAAAEIDQYRTSWATRSARPSALCAATSRTSAGRSSASERHQSVVMYALASGRSALASAQFEQASRGLSGEAFPDLEHWHDLDIRPREELGPDGRECRMAASVPHANGLRSVHSQP